MLIVDTTNICKENMYYCYSPNLYKFLRYMKQIEPIGIKPHYTTKRKFSIFVKNDILQEALLEWKNNKLNGIFAIQNGAIQYGKNYNPGNEGDLSEE